MNTITSNVALPPQMLPLKEKTEKWIKDCLDAMEGIGRQQFMQNARFIENYEMVRGKFIFSHYLETDEYADMVGQLTKEFDIPKHLRHYDIISQIINVLSGEQQKRPDIFRVKAYDEQSSSNYIRKKTDLLMEYAMQEITNQINEKLEAEGLDPYKKDFGSQEEADQYNQQLEQRKQVLTPDSIQKYMDLDWMDEGEIWATHQLELDKQRFNLPEMEKIEFEDMLISDRCFRHFYLTADGYKQETWNPINTFFHKSPEIRYVENGDYVGRVFYLTANEIINRYGHRMTIDQLDQLEETKREEYDSKNKLLGKDPMGMTPGSSIPYANYPEQRMVEGMLGFNPNVPQTGDSHILAALGDSGAQYSMNGLFQVTESYWISQRKIGKYVTGEGDIVYVDETLEKLPGVKELKNSFSESGDDEQPNTITWTWVPELRDGVKINNWYSNLKEPIYLGGERSEFQFRGDLNIYGAKLPVCGQVFNNRNAESQSLVDLVKPHQIGHNIAMNQLYEIMQREMGRFMLMDFNFLPSGKDWGGEKSMEKFALIAKQLGIGVIDGKSTNTGGQTAMQTSDFRMIDMDESARMTSRMNIAIFFEQQGGKQVGITDQRKGQTTASESATGVEQAVNQSYAQTESYFTNFTNYKRRCMQMSLEIAQYVASKESDITQTYTKSDLSRAFSKINGTDLLLAEFGIYVVASQEVVRQLETLRQLFIENNTSGASPVDLATVVMSNSPAEIKAQLETSWKQQQQLQQGQTEAEQAAQQKQLEMADMLAEKQRQFDAQEHELDRANERYIAEVKAMSTAAINNDPDMDQNGIPDVLEVQRFNLDQQKHTEDILFKRQEMAHKVKLEKNKLELEREKIAQRDDEIAARKEDLKAKLAMDEKKLKADLQIKKIQARKAARPPAKKK